MKDWKIVEHDTETKWWAQLLNEKEEEITHCGYKGVSFTHEGETFFLTGGDYHLPDLKELTLYRMVAVETAVERSSE